MSDFTDLARQVGELRRQLVDVVVESRLNAGTLATAIRKTRRQVDANELESSIRRGRPSSAAQLWDPRGGQFVEPDLATSLISRLRAGEPIGNRMGSDVSDFGLRNLFKDARLTSLSKNSVVLNDGALHRASKDWSAITAFGATGATALVVEPDADAFDPANNPLATARFEFRLEDWTAAGTATMKAKAAVAQPDYDPTVLPWAVFSVALLRPVARGDFTACSAVTIQLHVRDSADTTDRAVSVPVDWLGTVDEGEVLRLWAAVATSELAADALSAQVWVTVTTTGTSAAAGEVPVWFGDPMFELSSIQTPSAFQPETTASNVVTWGLTGDGVDALSVGLMTESLARRLQLGLKTTDAAVIYFGPGSSGVDVQIFRSGTKELSIQDNTGALATVLLGHLGIGGSYRLSGVISPAQIVANTDNYNPTNLHTTSVLRINSDAARNLTGLNAGVAGETILLVNTGAFTITLVHDATSTAANRFYCPGSANASLTANRSLLLWYDITSARWRVVG